MEIVIGEWKLRPWLDSDAESLAKHANNRKIWRNMLDAFPHPYTQADALTWIGGHLPEDPPMSFAIASDKEAIGAIGLHIGKDVGRRSAMVGYWLGEPYWGKGIATRAVSALMEYAFKSFDLVRLEAVVYEWNPASMRVLEKAGFSLESRMRKSVAKDGQTIDAFRYVLIRDG